jgi:hypothetical protein
MDDKTPQFIRDILEILGKAKYRYKFELSTGYPLSTYKNNTELATAFMFYKARAGFDYGLMYPKHPKYGERQCEIDFSLHRARVFNLPPWYGDIIDWPPEKPVMYVENKRNIRHKYEPKPKEVVEGMMERRRWAGSGHALLQREFLLSKGYETLPLGDTELEWLYYHGLFADR